MTQKGITLVELLISASIAALVGSLLLIIVVNSSGLFYKESSKVDMGLATNDVLGEVRKSIKQSSAVEASYAVDSVTYTSGLTQLVLKIPSIDSSNNIIPSTFDYFVFFQDEKKLRLKTFPDASSSRKASDRIFATTVDELVFNYYNFENPPSEVTPANATKIKISLKLKQRSGATHETNTATSEANLRND